MSDGRTSSKTPPQTPSWSNRILIAALVGVLFLTLYPFRFALPQGRGPSYLLNGWGKNAKMLDVYLNILLFVPFGFGLGEKFRERGKSSLVALGLAWVAGALLSYGVEFLQFYIPVRDSGWEDVLTNSTGSLVGALLFVACGTAVLLLLSGTERLLTGWLTRPRVALLLTLYFGVWLAWCIPLQERTRLDNWEKDSRIAVANTASGRFTPAWKGQVSQVEFWDHAVSREFAEGITSGAPVGLAPVASYDLSGAPPFQDQRHLLPDISWARQPPVRFAPEPDATLDGTSWLATRTTVGALVTAIQTTNQFALRVRCQPADVVGPRSSIISISQPSGSSNLELQQDGSDLVLWFRNRVSVSRSALDWIIPGVFAASQPRDILFSYDGANLSLYVNGNADRRTYTLGPSVAVAQLIRRVRPSEFQGYRYAFYALLFFPAGLLLEFARRKEAARRIPRRALLCLACLVPSVLVELAFVHVSGRAISSGNIALSLVLMLSACLWLNADSPQQ